MIDSSFMMLDDAFEKNEDIFRVPIRDGFKRLQESYGKSEKKTMKNMNREVDMVILNGPD